MAAVILAFSETVMGDISLEYDSSDGSSDDFSSSTSPSSPSPSHQPTLSHHIAPSAGPGDSLSEHEWVLRYEAVRSQTGTFVLSRQTILDFLYQIQGDVDLAVRNLQDAHQRRYTGSLRLLGGRPGDHQLPDRVQGFTIQYFRTGEQERRQAADLFFLLVAQHNLQRKRGQIIHLARSEAVLILDAAAWDFEEALKIVGQDRETVAQMLHIRVDHLRLRSGTEQEQWEQEDAALAYYLTLTDRADMHTLQQHLNSHGGDLVAAIADWQQNGVDPVPHPEDNGQTQSTSWIGRRVTIQEDGHRIVLRPMPTLEEVHEYQTRTLGWAQEPHRFALTTTEEGAKHKVAVLRVDKIVRNNRHYSSVINYDRDGLTKGCPNPRKFLIEYLEKGRYRSNGFDVVNPGMKQRTGKYFWPGKGLTNTGKKPVFDVDDRAHLKHFNGLYRQGLYRPTGIVARDPSTEWSVTEIQTLWELYAEQLHELLTYGRLHGVEVSIPFNVTEATKKEMAETIEKIHGEERSANSVITMAHRNRRICKDFGLTFETSNEVRRETNERVQMLRDQVDRVSAAIKKERESLSSDDILAAIEQITGPWTPFEWDIDMAIDATPRPRQLPSTGLPLVGLAELQIEVQQALNNILTHFRKARAWEQAAQAVRYYYRSAAGRQERIVMQPLLVRMGMRTLDLHTLVEEEGLAIFEGIARREQMQEGRASMDQLNSLVTTSRQALATGPATMPVGGLMHEIDAASFGVGSGNAGWLTDNAVEAGLQTLALQNTAVIDLHGARLHFLNPATNPLPAINLAAENVALIFHDVNHWAVGIYNTTTQQYHLLDSLPSLRRRTRMEWQMQAVVQNYFPGHTPMQATSRSFRQNNGRDCGLYVIENIRSIDRGMLLREVNGFEARMRILSEIMRLATPAPAVPNPALAFGSNGASSDKLHSGGHQLIRSWRVGIQDFEEDKEG
jgi:hypothetical protein